MIRTLRNRLERIEANRGSDEIRTVAAGRTITPDEIADAMMNWRAWAEDGRASRTGGTLYIRPPVLTVAEWTAEVTPRGTVH